MTEEKKASETELISSSEYEKHLREFNEKYSIYTQVKEEIEIEYKKNNQEKNELSELKDMLNKKKREHLRLTDAEKYTLSKKRG